MKIFVYVTLPLNPLPREGDLLSLRSKSCHIIFNFHSGDCHVALRAPRNDIYMPSFKDCYGLADLAMTLSSFKDCHGPADLAMTLSS